MKKRQWTYILKPAEYEIACDKCGKLNVMWSEYEGKIWCYECEIDTKGNGGIFMGPIPRKLCDMLGISFDRLNVETGKVVKFEDKEKWEKTFEVGV